MLEQGSKDAKNGKDLLNLIPQAARSAEFRSLFRQWSFVERSGLLREMLDVQDNLRMEHEALMRIEFMFRKDEVGHPEKVIRRVLRGDGKYLEFSPYYSDKIAQSVTDYLEFLQGHVNRYGTDSIAHLCLPKFSFIRLTGGVALKTSYQGEREAVVVNTIGELRDLGDRLERNPRIRDYSLRE